MDFELNDDQRAILDAVGVLLERHAGPERAIEIQTRGEYDVELDAALAAAGFDDVARDSTMGPLDAALISEAVSRASISDRL